MSIRAHHGLLLDGAGGGPPPAPELDATEHIVSSFTQSSVYAGQVAASVSNMSDPNGNGDSVTGTATDASGTQFIRADLGTAKTVTRIRLGGGSLSGWGGIVPTYLLGSAFLIQHSDDGSTWTTLNNTFVDGTNDGASERDVDIFVPPTTARYFRLTRSGDIATATFRVFGYTAPVIAITDITYSQSSAYTGANVGTELNLNEFPLDPTTGAATNSSAGEWVKADLGSAKTIAAVVLGAGPSLINWGAVANPYLNGCELQYSTDDVTWTTALTVTNATDDAPSVWPREIALISARYWRVFRSASGYVALTAFRLYA